MTQAPRTADHRTDLADADVDAAAGADEAAAPIDPVSGVASGTPDDGEGDAEREKGFGNLKQNRTNHWTVQDR